VPLANRATAAVPVVREGVIGRPGNVEIEQVVMALDEDAVGAGDSDFIGLGDGGVVELGAPTSHDGIDGSVRI